MDHSEYFPDLEQEMESLQQENYFNGNFNIENPLGDIDIHGDEVPDIPPSENAPPTEAGEQRIQDTIALLRGDENGTGDVHPLRSNNTKHLYDEEYKNITTTYPSLQYNENDT